MSETHQPLPAATEPSGDPVPPPLHPRTSLAPADIDSATLKWRFHDPVQFFNNPFRRVFHNISQFALWTFFIICFGYTVRGRENIPPVSSGTFIAVGNHTSAWDPPLMGTSIFPRPVAFMAKAEFFQHFWTGWWLGHMLGSFPVNRNKVEKSTLKTAKALLQKSPWCLGVFPEGTRVRTGNLQNFKRGAAVISHISGKPLLPIAIVWKPSRLWKKRAFIQIGTLLPPCHDTDTAGQQLQDAIAQLMAQLEA
jgi:1-acyl-sn-glycerol-3-phosphate acyltransferase